MKIQDAYTSFEEAAKHYPVSKYLWDSNIDLAIFAQEPKIFLDDERFPTDPEFLICRTRQEFFAAIILCDRTPVISMDHDLGPDQPTGYDILKELVSMQQDLLTEGDCIDYTAKITVHSQNPVGKKNMEAYLESWRAHCPNSLYDGHSWKFSSITAST